MYADQPQQVAFDSLFQGKVEEVQLYWTHLQNCNKSESMRDKIVSFLQRKMSIMMLSV